MLYTSSHHSHVDLFVLMHEIFSYEQVWSETEFFTYNNRPWAAVCSKAVVLLLLTGRLLLLPLWESVIVLCFGVCYFYVNSSFAIILMGKRELVALLSLSSRCLVIVVWLFLAVTWVCLQFVIVVFPEHTHYFYFWSGVVGSFALHPVSPRWTVVYGLVVQEIWSKHKFYIYVTVDITL